MSVTVHNPDHYMAELRTIIAQGRKRIGLLIGAGAPAGMADDQGKMPLIPAVAQLTEHVVTALAGLYGTQIAALRDELEKKDIETLLSRVRSLSQVIGKSQVHGFDSSGYAALGEAICAEIGKVVNVHLPKASPYMELVNWIVGTPRSHPVEIFTTNYDLLFEEAFEKVGAPYFDGFSGGREPFFDPVSVASNDLPPRWTRLWKLHGSLGWRAGSRGEVIRTGQNNVTHLVFPEHLKYDQTQKAPYAALFDRLRAFLATPDTLLISIGFSFADAHVASRVGEGLAGNPSASVFAFQFRKLNEEASACELGEHHPNFSVYGRDSAVVNGRRGPWAISAEMPSKDWAPIRATYWGITQQDSTPHFMLGCVDHFCGFFAASRSTQAFEQAASEQPKTLETPE